MAPIDLPFTKGIDESVDETVLGPPGMTELVNYRLTRAGRLEHRLGVVDVPFTDTIATTTGDDPDAAKTQALSGRLLAAGGHGYVCTGGGSWACVGSVPRFVPTESYQGVQGSPYNYRSPSCTSAAGYLVVLAQLDDAVNGQYVSIFDEVTGTKVWSDAFGTGGGNLNIGRVVTCGTTVVVVYQDLATGDIYATKMDLSVTPFAGFPAGTFITTAAAGSGFDACPVSNTTFAISYETTLGLAAMALVTASTFAVAAINADTDGAGAKLTTCLSINNGVYNFLVWMNTGTRAIIGAVFNASMVQIGTRATLGSAPGTLFSNDNFHPVIGRGGDLVAMVAWTDSYTTGTYRTFRTSFAGLDNTSASVGTYGVIYGYGLASKPFRSGEVMQGTSAPAAIWLANHMSGTTALDRSYFLMLLDQFESTSNNAAGTLELSAAPSAALPVIELLGQTIQVSEVVQSTASGQKHWQTVLTEAFRGLGTADVQAKAQVYRFAEAAQSGRARTRCVVPAQGSLVLLGGQSRYFDTDALVELGIPHGVSVSQGTPAATGGMTAGGTYRYVFVLEYIDGQGQRHLSYASDPYTVTLGGGDGQVNFELQVPSLWAFPNTATLEDERKIVVRAYRTSNNGTVFRYAPETSAPNGMFAGPLVSRARVQYQDVNSDTDIAGNEALYTQVGNALSNYRAPACRFGCEHEGRLVVAGGWNPSEYIASKLFFAGEGIQFTESSAFRDTCPEPITGCASLDGTLVLFAERGIYAVNGDGPTDDGVGAFSKPRRLPGIVGCVDWRSVLTTDAGVFFRSRDGLYLLPRGLAAPQFVGAPIRHKLRMFPETLGCAIVTRAVSEDVTDADSEQIAAWLVADAEPPTAVKIYTLSLTTQTWAEIRLPEDAANLQQVIGTWTDIANGTDVLGFARETIEAAEFGSLFVENPGTGYDEDVGGGFEPLLNGSWKTGKIFPFGFGGRGSIRSVRLVGDCLHATTLTPTIYSDAEPAGYVSTALNFAAGRFAVEVPFRRKDLAWIQVGVADPTTGDANRGAGLRFNGLALEVEMEPGLHRSNPTNRSI